MAEVMIYLVCFLKTHCHTWHVVGLELYLRISNLEQSEGEIMLYENNLKIKEGKCCRGDVA